MNSNVNLKGNKTLIGLILILILICSLTALFAFNTQNSLTNLRSSYNALYSQYNNLQNKLNNLQSTLNNVENNILMNSSQERISFVSVVALDESSVRVRAKSLTGVDIVVVNAVVRDSSNNIIANNNSQMTPVILPATGSFETLDITFQNAHFDFGTTYSITLITEKGNSFTDSSFTRINTAPTPSPQPFP